jgi:hypothetical protein
MSRIVPRAGDFTLLLAALKEMGGIVLMVSVMLFFASRDPERNVAIIDALIVGLWSIHLKLTLRPQKDGQAARKRLTVSPRCPDEASPAMTSPGQVSDR